MIGSIALPRWMSWYWDLPVETLEPDRLDEAAPGDLVLLRWDRLPPWAPDLRTVVSAGDLGRYSLVEARHLLPGPASD